MQECGPDVVFHLVRWFLRGYRMTSRVDRIRGAVRAGRYRLSQHAWEALEEDDFVLADIEAGIESSRWTVKQVDRVTGQRKYVFTGIALDERTISVVCRLESTGRVRVITVFEGGAR